LTVGIVNEGPVPVSFDFAEADINDSLVVTGPDGRRVPYILGHVDSNGPTLQLAPGEVAHFTQDFDLAEQYLIDKPGHYVVRYEGKNLIIDDLPAKLLPAAVDIDVAPGKLDRRTEIAARLLPVVPKDLMFCLSPRDDENSKEIEVEIRHYVYREEGTLPKEIESMVTVIGFELRIAPRPPHPDEKFLGKTRWGFLFANVEKRTEEFWPNWRKLVAEALEVR
jgi:hypothetical protein